MRGDRDRLLDILDAVDKIEERVKGDRELFERDEMVHVWVLYHLQIIGEAAAKVSEPLRSEFPKVPWPDIVSMRNAIVHHYFGIDLDQIWHTVSHDLSVLKAWVSHMLETS